MAASLTVRHPAAIVADSTHRSALTSALLGCGVVAGPFYLALGLAQALTRPGFDLTRHELSQLALGEWGWVQIANLYLTGLLVLASALGMHQLLRTGRGRTWVPRLVGLYGLGMIGAGVFTADPGLGFPPGTPADTMTISTHGLLHLAFAAVGFCGLIVASISYGRRCLALGQPGWAAYSIATGVGFLVTFVSGAMLAGAVGTHSLATLLLWIGVLIAWCWLTTTSLRLLATR
jgi:hypothetical protein